MADAALLERCFRPAVVEAKPNLCGATDVGVSRELNEDAFFVSEDGRFFVVADGLGGLPSGEIASAVAVRAAEQVLASKAPMTGFRGRAAIEQRLMEAVLAAHDAILVEAASYPDCQGMATTLIVAWVTPKHVFTCHVGDVRGYVIQRGSDGVLVTSDHSVVGELVRSGDLEFEKLADHPQRHLVTQAVGLPEDLAPELAVFPLAVGDSVVLCSDGLWDALAANELESVVRGGGTARDRAVELIERANAAGGADNITVVVYDHLAQSS